MWMQLRSGYYMYIRYVVTGGNGLTDIAFISIIGFSPPIIMRKLMFKYELHTCHMIVIKPVILAHKCLFV